jgi:hypothetical protein
MPSSMAGRSWISPSIDSPLAAGGDRRVVRLAVQAAGRAGIPRDKLKQLKTQPAGHRPLDPRRSPVLEEELATTGPLFHVKRRLLGRVWLIWGDRFYDSVQVV